jgi:hypothetical protein
MKLKIFSVYDCKVEAYLQPFFMRSKGEALRAFMSAVDDKQTQFNKNPEDFTLFELGEFDDEKGKVNSINPTSLGTALEFKAKNENERIGLVKEINNDVDNMM